MKLSLDKYIARGGTKRKLARTCGVSDTQIAKLGRQKRGLMIEFNPMNISHIFKVWIPAEKVMKPERILFEATE